MENLFCLANESIWGSKMKILQVVSSPPFCWDSGGPARSVWEISKSLVKNEHKVTICSTNQHKGDDNLPTNKHFYKDGVEIYRFKNISNTLAWKHLSFAPQFGEFIKNKCDEFDIVHLNEYRTFQVAMYFKNRNKDVPFIIQPRGSTQKLQKRLIKYFYDKIIGHNILKKSSKILLSSKNEFLLAKPEFEKVGIDEKKISYIPNGIDIKDKNCNPKKFREENEIDEEDKIILYLGRISKRKGSDLLVKAFERIAEKEEGLKLVIIGPKSSYLKKLKKLINNSPHKDKIILPGPLYDERKYSAYKAADVFVLPSKDRQESFGNVALEASSVGTSCVVTNVCGVTEWVDNIIEVDPNIKSIEKGVIEGLSDKEIGKKAQKEVTQKVSWNSVVENYLIPIYRNILN